MWLTNPTQFGRADPGEHAEEIEVSIQPTAVAVGRWAVWVVGDGEDGLSIVDPDMDEETLVSRLDEPPVDMADPGCVPERNPGWCPNAIPAACPNAIAVQKSPTYA